MENTTAQLAEDIAIAAIAVTAATAAKAKCKDCRNYVSQCTCTIQGRRTSGQTYAGGRTYGGW